MSDQLGNQKPSKMSFLDVQKFTQLLSKYVGNNQTNFTGQTVGNDEPNHEAEEEHQEESSSVQQLQNSPPIQINDNSSEQLQLLSQQQQQKQQQLSQPQKSKDEKIYQDDVLKLVALQKQRSRGVKTIPSSQVQQAQLFQLVKESLKKKAVQSPLSNEDSQKVHDQPQNQPNFNQANCQNGQQNQQKGRKDSLPKVSTMNNLLKLSTQINMSEFLKQVNYRAHLYRINVMKLLFFFCVEKMIYIIYAGNGLEKMKQKQGNTQFIMKQICKALINLLTFIKINEKALINRTLQAVFIRFNIRNHFTSNFLIKSIKENKVLFEKTGADIQHILSQSQNKKISNSIFTNVPKVERPIRYDHLKLNLQNQDLTSQLIDDPQVYQQKSKLYYYESLASKVKGKSLTPPTKNGTKNQSNSLGKLHKASFQQIDSSDNFYQQEDENVMPKQAYNPSSFAVTLKKTIIPENTKVYKSSLNEKDFEIIKAPKPKQNSVAINGVKDELTATKRKRTMPMPAQAYIQESKEKDKEREPGIAKQKILQYVEEYIFNNIGDIATRIADHWKLKPQEITTILQQHPQNRPIKAINLSTNVNKTPITKVQPSTRLSMAQIESNIVETLWRTSQNYKAQGLNDKEAMREVLKLVEQKDIPHESKARILTQLIQRRKKASSRK